MKQLCARLAGLIVVVIASAPASAQSVMTSVPLGDRARAIAVNVATNKAYAVAGPGNTLVEIDGLTGAKVSIPLQNAGSGPEHVEVAVNQRTNTIYVTNVVSGNLAVVNGATRTVSLVPLGAITYTMAVNATTNTIYVTHYNDHFVSTIDGATRAVETVAVGINPEQIAVNEKTNRIYVSNNNSNTVSVINGADHSVVHVPVGAYPSALAIDVKKNMVYVANLLGDSLTVINGTTHATQPIPMPPGRFPFHLAFNATLGRVYVSFQVGGSIAVVNTKNRAVQMVNTGSYESEILVDPWRNRLYIADSPANQLVAIDLVTFSRTSVANPGNFLWKLALNPLTNVLYGPSLLSNSVSVFSGSPVAIPWTVLRGMGL